MGEPARKMPTNDFMATVTNTAKTKKASTTTKDEVVLDGGPEIQQAVDQWVEYKRMFDEGKSGKDIAGAPIREYASVVQDQDGFAGRFRHQYVIKGTNGNQLKFKSSNRFKINPDDKDSIVNEVGEDMFPVLFEEVFNSTFKQELFQNKEMQKKLQKWLGPHFQEFMQTFVETVVTIKPRKGFDSMIYQSLKPEQIDNLRVFITQYQPALI
jgi:hypothetical protein